GPHPPDGDERRRGRAGGGDDAPARLRTAAPGATARRPRGGVPARRAGACRAGSATRAGDLIESVLSTTWVPWADSVRRQAATPAADAVAPSTAPSPGGGG